MGKEHVRKWAGGPQLLRKPIKLVLYLPNQTYGLSNMFNYAENKLVT